MSKRGPGKGGRQDGMSNQDTTNESSASNANDTNDETSQGATAGMEVFSLDALITGKSSKLSKRG